MKSSFTLIVGNQRHEAKNLAAAIDLCSSGEISIDAEVIEHTGLGDRPAPIKHFDRLFREVCRAKGVIMPPGRRFGFFQVLAGASAILCFLAAILFIFADHGDKPDLKLKWKAIAGAILLGAYFSQQFFRERKMNAERQCKPA